MLEGLTGQQKFWVFLKIGTWLLLFVTIILKAWSWVFIFGAMALWDIWNIVRDYKNEKRNKRT